MLVNLLPVSHGLSDFSGDLSVTFAKRSMRYDQLGGFIHLSEKQGLSLGGMFVP